MSRKKDPIDQLGDDLGCLIIGLMWAAIVGLFTVLFKSAQVSPEDQLLRLQPGGIWKRKIEPRNCFQCGTVNESQQDTCYQCGAKLAAPAETKRQAETAVASGDGIGSVIAIILFFVFAAIFCAVIASQGG